MSDSGPFNFDRFDVRPVAPPTDVRSISDLFSRWQAEDGPADVDDLAKRHADFEQFKVAMNKNRRESDGSNARKAFR